MFRLSAAELLVIWETGESLMPMERALAILSAACPERGQEQLLDLSVGQCDRQLLLFRQWLFGPSLQSFAECPACAQRLEFALDIPQICSAEYVEPPESQKFAIDAYEIDFRAPRCRDLLSIAACPHLVQARDELIRRCVLSARCHGLPVSERIPDQLTEQLAERILASDALQEILLDLNCPECDQRWKSPFRVIDFLWIELQTYSKRLLAEVHALARAYGWREQDILAMHAQRRQAYLTMVGV